MNTVRAKSDYAEPAWEISRLFPAQGDWTEEDYSVSIDELFMAPKKPFNNQ